MLKSLRMSLKLIFLVVVAAVTLSLSTAQVRERYIELPVDHFNVLNRRTFDARYFVNDQHWYPGGVIFIYVSGGLEAYDEFLNSGMMFELAEETNSHLFTMEQRFFGETRPTEDLSTDNLRFLTVQQSVADIAAFVGFIRENYYGARNSRVILWGRGYGGALAVWARQKYPHMVDAVWASSAPIHLVADYPRLLSNAFYTFTSIGGPECSDIIAGAFRTIENSIRLRNSTEVENRLKFCSPIDSEIDEEVTHLFYGMAADIAYNFVTNTNYTAVDDVCIRMRGLDDPENAPTSDLDAFGRWFADELFEDRECLNYNRADLLEQHRDVEFGSYANFAGRRQLLWIYCTQLGQFPIANEGEGHPFGWRFDRRYFVNWCADVFDIRDFDEEFMVQSIAETNTMFGGLDPKIYRAFYTHGEMDPRHNLGPNEDLNEKAPVVVMSLQSWGRDFGSPSATDYVVLQETKAMARDLMIEWIFDAIGEQPTPSPPVSPLNDIENE